MKQINNLIQFIHQPLILSLFSSIKSSIFLKKYLYFFTNTVLYLVLLFMSNYMINKICYGKKSKIFYVNHTLKLKNFYNKKQSVINLMEKISSLHLEDYRFDPYITLCNNEKNYQKKLKKNKLNFTDFFNIVNVASTAINLRKVLKNAFYTRKPKYLN